jgi:hypothetical protein
MHMDVDFTARFLTARSYQCYFVEGDAADLFFMSECLYVYQTLHTTLAGLFLILEICKSKPHHATSGLACNLQTTLSSSSCLHWPSFRDCR